MFLSHVTSTKRSSLIGLDGRFVCFSDAYEPMRQALLFCSLLSNWVTRLIVKPRHAAKSHELFFYMWLNLKELPNETRTLATKRRRGALEGCDVVERETRDHSFSFLLWGRP